MFHLSGQSWHGFTFLSSFPGFYLIFNFYLMSSSFVTKMHLIAYPTIEINRDDLDGLPFLLEAMSKSSFDLSSV